MKKIAIIDYGVGNLGSLRRALERVAEVEIVEDPERLADKDGLVLPGVGSFKAGMDGLMVRGLADAVVSRAKAGTPILGICLGAQLLLERGYEFGEHAGLGLIKGEVRHVPELSAKVPIIGWQTVTPTEQSKKALFEHIPEGSFYFVHSYTLNPTESSACIATTTYSGYTYCAAIGEGNILGTQFHPEKSGKDGLQLIDNFVRSI